MDTKDTITFLLGIAAVIILAIVINPMVTGESPDLSIPSIPGWNQEERAAAPTPPPTPVPLGQITIPHPSRVEGSKIGESPIESWDGRPITLGYVDPATYHLQREDTRLTSRAPIESYPIDDVLETYATFQGKWSGTSEIFHVPFPRWELWYTITPSISPAGGSNPQTVGIPRFSITVVDAQNPDRTVVTLSPGTIVDDRIWSTNDPRPWKHKFYEGGRSYYMIIESRLIESYMIEIRVPAPATAAA